MTGIGIWIKTPKISDKEPTQLYIYLPHHWHVLYFYKMDLVIISKEDLEELVKTSVNKALANFFTEKEERA